jgi:hypothetical protein
LFPRCVRVLAKKFFDLLAHDVVSSVGLRCRVAMNGSRLGRSCKCTCSHGRFALQNELHHGATSLVLPVTGVVV